MESFMRLPVEGIVTIRERAGDRPFVVTGGSIKYNRIKKYSLMDGSVVLNRATKQGFRSDY